MPLTKEDIDAFEKGLKLEEEARSGKETLVARLHENKVVVRTQRAGPAKPSPGMPTDLKDFPLQIEDEGEGKHGADAFHPAPVQKPDPQQFDVPLPTA